MGAAVASSIINYETPLPPPAHEKNLNATKTILLFGKRSNVVVVCSVFFESGEFFKSSGYSDPCSLVCVCVSAFHAWGCELAID
jgi:hypothetical protein